MKSPLLFLVLTFWACSAMAQTGVLRGWERALNNQNGPQVITFNGVEAVTGGSVAFGAASTSDGTKMYAAKYDGSGQMLWERSLPSAQVSSLYNLYEDGQGNLILIGVEFLPTASDPDIHIAKLNGAGQVQWQKQYNGPNGLADSYTESRLVGNHLYLCGEEEQASGNRTAWVAKLDLDGNVVWDKGFDPGLYCGFYGLAVDNSGTVTAVGSSDGDYSFLAVQYDNAGNLLWQYPDTLTGSNEAWLTDAVADNQGNVYAVGTLEVGSFFEYDIVTLKLNQNGELEWQEHYNNGGENNGSFVRLGSDGRVYSFGNKEDNFDYFVQISVYESDGQLAWTDQYDIDGYTTVAGAELDANDDIYLAVGDFDFWGFVAFSKSGTLLGDQIYDNSAIDYVSGLSVSGGEIWGTGYNFEDSRSQLVSMQKSSLTENFVVEGSGLPLSDVRPGGLVSDGTRLWMSSFADDGDSGTFTITQLDLSGNVNWERSVRRETSNPGYPFLAHDGNGGIAGFYKSLITGGNTTMGLVKYDASGNEVFSVYLDSATTFYTGGLVTTPNETYITGYNQNTKLMFLSQYDNTGTQQWIKTFKSPSASFPYSGPFDMKLTGQNKLVMVTSYKNASNDNDLHLFQYDLSGTLEWDLAVDVQSGNLTALTGFEVAANGDITLFGSSGIGTWVGARYDNIGALIWEQKGSSSLMGAPRSMAVDASGNTYLGFSTSTHTYLRKHGSDGSLLADTEVSTPTSGSFFFPWSMTFLGSQLVILGDHLMPSQSAPWEALLEPDLSLVNIHVDSTVNAKFYAMAADGGGHLYGTYGVGDQSSQTAFRTGLIRQYRIGTVGIENDMTDQIQLSVFPNPARESIILSLQSQVAGNIQISLYDLDGRLISTEFSQRHQSASESIRFSLPGGLATGIYLIQVTVGEETSWKKLLIRN